ncbi:MAG: translation elongation factor 4 [Patescibacteria group bacterium]
MNNIRNFVIISHVDHGKSTLADRMLEITGTIEKRQMKPQYLDRLESERERGITIKMAPVRMNYTFSHPEHSEGSVKDSSFTAKAGTQNDNGLYILNLIDTPGHSDFSYEVSRALAAVEGAILLVDVTQGIQAQTLANFNAAKKAGLTIIGAVSKIDLNPPDLEEVVQSLADLLKVEPEEILKISGKTGEGVEELLEEVIKKVPSPRHPEHSEGSDGVSRALIFDSLYDDHRGVIAFVRIFNGGFNNGNQIQFLATKTSAKIKEVGYFHPQLKSSKELNAGEIGYIATGIKDIGPVKIGDTIISNFKFQISNFDKLVLPGYAESQPVVFVSFYPEDSSEYSDLKNALEKLKLTDSSLFFEQDKSELLGKGFKCGFLGQLHFEITAERLQKEFKIATIHSFPSVTYQISINGCRKPINSPKDFPAEYDEAEEPVVELEIVAPPQYLGGVMSLKKWFRLSGFETENIGEKLVLVTAKLPLADLISDFDDKLKSLSEGYASLSYKLIGYEKSNLEKLEILIAGHLVPGLTRIVPKEKLEREARQTVEKLKELLPRQQFVQAIQAAVGGKIIARETISAFKKDVTGYLYGGDRTRKMKLWKKQQKGKAKLQERAEKSQVQIPTSIFKELLKK